MDAVYFVVTSAGIASHFLMFPSLKAAETGPVLLILLFSLLIAKCFQTARKERVQKICLYALALFLLLIPMVGLLSIVGESRILAGLLVFLMMGCGVSSLVLAIVGLVQWGSQRSSYDRGRWQGIVALAGSGLACLSMLAAMVMGFIQASGGLRNIPIAEDLKGQEKYVLDQYNVSFEHIGDAWMAIDAEDFNAAARLVLVQRRPEQYLMVIPEILGIDQGLTLDGYVEVARANMRSGADEVSLQEPTPFEVDGIPGKLFTGQARIGLSRLHYESWCGIKNGLAIQVICFGNQKDKELLRDSHRTFLATLDLLDRNRVLSLTGGQVRGLVDLPEEGFSVKLAAREGWVEGNRALFPLTAFRAQSIHGGQLNVSRADLRGLEADFDALAAAMLAMQNMVLTDHTIVSRKERMREDGVRVLDLVLLYEQSARPFRDYYRIYGRGDQYVMINTWNETDERRLEWNPSAALDSVRIHEQLPNLAYPEMDDDRRVAQGQFMNEVGLHYFRHENYDAAFSFFTEASTIDPENQILSGNRVTALVRMEAYERVLEETDRHLAEFPDDFLGWGDRALALEALDREEEALAIYERIFAEGCEDEDILFNYITLLVDMNQAVGALLVIEREADERPERQLLLWEGQVARVAGEYRQSEAAFRQIAEREGWDSELYAEVVEVFLEEGDYQAAWDWLNRQETQMGPVFAVWLGRGRVQLAREDLLEAHVSFTQALEVLPGDPDARDFLEEVNRRLAAREPVE